MSELSARDWATTAAELLRHEALDERPIPAADAALVAIALHLTEDGFATAELSSFEPPLSELAEVIWKASRADEGTISATGADVVARAVLEWWNSWPTDEALPPAAELSPVLTGDDTEVRQPTGLNRLLTEPAPAHLPGNIIVTPTEWSLWNDDRTVFYGLITPDDGSSGYSTHHCGTRTQGHPSLAAAVAYLIQRRTEETGDAS